ncbi:metallophosphoesterase [Paenibacillus pasadenensis]|uniref:Phosphoesterase n=1 Tax=Paenibacillus pasadenensis TaxID=217090 RepID=A0A2N5N6C8_9BACL|nr:metallophosphoesterase [Paenibacillus pasadenensis]PLT45907.1 Phosphoesterase [Paenibacillus pasadenensis]
MSRRWLALVSVIVIYAALIYYIGWNLSLFLASQGLSPGIGMWTAVVLASVSYFLAMALVRFWGALPARLFKAAASYSIAALEYLILLLPLADLGWLAARAAGVSFDAYAGAAGWTVLLLLLVLLAWGTRNAFSPIVRRHSVQVDKPMADRDSVTLLVASDIHLGDIVGKRHLRKLVRISQELRPDLILLPGDVLDDSVKPFLHLRMAEVISQLKAPLGTYAVLGNHEYYGGDIPAYVGAMKQAGIPVLQDEWIDAGGIVIAGRKDRTAESLPGAGRLPTAELLRDIDSSAPIVLLDHQPYGFAEAAAAGADVLLCGHTHRGQFAPNHLVTRRLFELDWGYMRKSLTHVFVSSGFGSWGPPVRLFSRSEALLITLTFRSS